MPNLLLLPRIYHFFAVGQDAGVAVTFNNTKRVVEALQHGAVLIDRSAEQQLHMASAASQY